MPGTKDLIKDFYAKYDPEAYSEEKVKQVEDFYKGDTDKLIKDFYAKYDPESYSEEKVSKVSEFYGLKKKEVSDTELDPQSKESDQQSKKPEEESKRYTEDGKEILSSSDDLTPEQVDELFTERKEGEELSFKIEGSEPQKVQMVDEYGRFVEPYKEPEKDKGLEAYAKANGLEEKLQAKLSQDKLKQGNYNDGDLFTIKNQQYKENLEKNKPEINQLDFEIQELDKQKAELAAEYGSLDKAPSEVVERINNSQAQLKQDKESIAGKAPSEELVEKIVEVDLFETQWDEWSDLFSDPLMVDSDAGENVERSYYMNQQKELLKNWLESNPQEANKLIQMTEKGMTLTSNQQYDLVMKANSSMIEDASSKMKDMEPEVESYLSDVKKLKEEYQLEMNGLKNNHPEIYKLVNQQELTEQDRLALQQKGGRDYVTKHTTPLKSSIDRLKKKQEDQEGIEEYQKLALKRKEYAQNLNVLIGGDKEKLDDMKLAFKSKLEAIEEEKELKKELQESPVKQMFDETTKAIYNSAVDFYGGSVDLGYMLYDKAARATYKDDDEYTYADKMFSQIKDYEENVIKFREAEMGALIEDGELNELAVLPTLARTITDMILLTKGGKAVSGTPGLTLKNAVKNSELITRSMVASADDYYEEALRSGLDQSDAVNHALRASITTSMLELVSPGETLFKKGLRDASLISLVKNSSKQGIRKEFAKNMGRELLQENLQEALQLGGDKLNNLITNYISDQGGLETAVSSDEILETVLLTSLTVGAIGGFNKMTGGNKTQVVNSSIYELAKNKEGANRVIQELSDNKTLTPSQAESLLKNIDIMEQSINEVVENTGEGVLVGKASILNYQIKELLEKRKSIKSEGLLKSNAEKVRNLQTQLDAVLNLDKAVKDSQKQSKPEKTVIPSDSLKETQEFARDEQVDIVYKDANLVPERLRELSKNETTNEDGGVTLSFDGGTLIDNNLGKEKKQAPEKTEETTQEATEVTENEVTEEQTQQTTEQATEEVTEVEEASETSDILNAENLETEKGVELVSVDNDKVTLKLDALVSIPEDIKVTKSEESQGLFKKSKTFNTITVSKNDAIELGYIKNKPENIDKELEAKEQVDNQTTEETTTPQEEVSDQTTTQDNIPEQVTELKSDDQITYDEDGESNAFTVKTSDLNVDPDRLQYKVEGIGEDGTTDALKTTKKFNKVAAGILTVWIDPKDGKKYVVNGHHRFGLAKRNNVDNLLVRFIKADTAEQARSLGALQNMMEGKGTEIDAAKFIRDSGTTIDEIAEQGVTLSDAKIDKAVKLSNLTKELFDLVVKGSLSVNKAAMIGELDPKIQEDIYRTVGNFSDKVVREVVNTAKKAKVETTTQQDLFGTTEESKSKAMEVFKLRSDIKTKIRGDKKALSNAVKNKERLEQAGNKIDVEGSLDMNKDANIQDSLFDKFSDRKELTDILNEGVERLEQAKNNKEKSKIKEETYEKYKQELQNQIDNALQTGKKASGKGKSVETKSEEKNKVKQFVKDQSGKTITDAEAEYLVEEGYTKDTYEEQLFKAGRELRQSLRSSMNNMSINPVNPEVLSKLAKYIRAWSLKNGANFKAFLADMKYNAAPWLRALFKRAAVAPINGIKYVAAKARGKEYKPMSFDSSLVKAGINNFSGSGALDYYKAYLSEISGYKNHEDLLARINNTLALNLVAQQSTVNKSEIDSLIEAKENLLNLKKEINKAIQKEKQMGIGQESDKLLFEEESIIKKLIEGEITEVSQLDNSVWKLHNETLREVFIKKIVDRRDPLSRVLNTIEKWHGKKLPFHSRVDALFDIQEGKVVAKTNEAMEWLVGRRTGLLGNKSITKESFAYKLKKDLGMTLEDFSKWMLVNHVPERNQRLEALAEERFAQEIEELDAKLNSGEIDASNHRVQLDDMQKRHDRERLITNTGMTTSDAEFAKRKIEEKYDRDKLVDFYKEYKENIIDKQINVLRDAGMLSKEQADNLKKGKGKGVDFQFYVPMKVLGSVVQDAVDFNAKYRPNRVQSKSSIKSISVDAKSGKFSLDERNNPIAQGLFDLAEAYKSAAINENIKQLSSIITQFPNKDVWSTTNSPEIADASGGTKIPFKYIGKDGNVVTKYVMLKDERLEKVFMISSPQDKLTKALKNLLGAFNKFSRAMYTTLNVSFGIPNAFRDVQDALFNLSGYEDPKLRRKFMKNLASSYKGVLMGEKGFTDKGMAKLYQEMIDNGGTVSWADLSGDPDQTIKDINKSLQSVRFDGTIKGGARYGAEALVAPIALFNNVLEQATRLAVYKTALDSGKSKDEAAHMSKNTTINFSKKGEWGSLINTVWLFSNAGIQGLNRVVETLNSKRGRKAAATLVGLGFSYSALIHYLLDDDEETERLLTQYDYKNNIILPLGEGRVFTIPKSYSGFKLFFNLGESIFKNGLKSDLSAVPGDLLGDLYDQINIIGGSSEATTAKLMPEIAKPLVEIISDGNNYFGKKFIPQYMEKDNVPNKDKYYKSTGNTFLGEKSIEFTDMIYDITEGGVDIAPEEMSHFITGYIYKGALTDIGRVNDVIKKLSNGETVKAKDVPIARRFFKDLSEEKHWRSYKKFDEIVKEGINDAMSAREIKMLNDLRKDVLKLKLESNYIKTLAKRGYKDTYKNQLRIYTEFEGWTKEEFNKFWHESKK